MKYSQTTNIKNDFNRGLSARIGKVIYGYALRSNMKSIYINF